METSVSLFTMVYAPYYFILFIRSPGTGRPYEAHARETAGISRDRKGIIKIC